MVLGMVCGTGRRVATTGLIDVEEVHGLKNGPGTFGSCCAGRLPPAPNVIHRPHAPISIGSGIAARRATAPAHSGFFRLPGLGGVVGEGSGQDPTVGVALLTFPVVDSRLRVGGCADTTCHVSVP